VVDLGADVIVAQGTDAGGQGARHGRSMLPFAPVVGPALLPQIQEVPATRATDELGRLVEAREVALCGGIEPLTTETLGSSSLVPWPNALSPLPLARSMPLLRPCTVDQSVFPAVLCTRLPSPPSKVLGASGGEHD
jgi:hypothetical protein